MGTTATPTAPVSSAKFGVKMRGLATSSFCLACWANLVFWWYPFGIMVAVLSLVFGVVTLALGVRSGRHGENLALGGVILSIIAITNSFVAYRGVQFFFEWIIPTLP